MFALRRSSVSRKGATPAIACLQYRHGTSQTFVPSMMPIVKSKWTAAVKVGDICNSMKNYAAGALPAMERHVGRARPLGEVLGPMMSCDEEPPNSNQKILHLCIGTDRGLCGALSSNTVRFAHGKSENAPANEDHKFIVYGNRTSEVARSLLRENLIYSVGSSKTQYPPFELCCQLAEKILYSFEWDKLIIHYNKYTNAVKYGLDTMVIYNRKQSEEIAFWQALYYEKAGNDFMIMQNLAEYKLASAIYWAIADNAVSEQASRLASMDGATKRCEEMVKEYESIYHKLRKTKITNELLIVAATVKLIEQNAAENK